MPRSHIPLSVSVLTCLLPVVGYACSGEIDQQNDRARTGPDCSYHFVGTYDMGLGGAAQDIGNGVVIQRLARQAACTDTEDLLVFDCGLGEAIIISGRSAYDECVRQMNAGTLEGEGCGFAAGYVDRSLEYVLSPTGPLDIEPGDNLSIIEAKVERSNVSARQVRDFFLGDVWWDRYDMRCGCQLFYPDSAGATQ